MKTALWWIRRDLRLSDNRALSAALSQAEEVVPVFVIDSRLLQSQYVGEKRLAFLFEGLRRLDQELRQRGSYLVIRRGEPVRALAELRNELGAEGIFAEEDYSPYARRRDQRASETLPLELVQGMTVHPLEAVVKADGTPYTVFTPYSKAWLSQPWRGKSLPAPSHVVTRAEVSSLEIPSNPTLSGDIPFIPGENEAHRRLEAFIDDSLIYYHDGRNRMDLDGTSGLSPYLRFGMITTRQAVEAAREAESQAIERNSLRSAETWLNELIWREFYISILYHFPFVRHKAFRPAMRDIPWINNPDDFAAWTEGQTGYPVVDAAMRQLMHTGWMHNRARMISASFLTKDLLVDWRRGERIFMQHLIDGDPASNNGGWQWTAGTGTDAAPYFRVFNPVLQSMKFDPNGDYIRRYVPELKNVPNEFIHNPWKMTEEMQRKSGCLIGKDYPEPIVDHSLARERALVAYRR